MIAIHISGIHCHLSDRTKEHITEKLGNLDRYHGSLHSVHVAIHPEKDGHRVDAVMHLHTGKEVVARHSDKLLFAAIDVVTAKCAAQLRRIHEREHEPHRHQPAIAM